MRQTRAPWDQVRALERNRPPSNFVLYQTYSLPESTDHLVIDLLISQGQMNMLPCQLTWSTIHHSSQYPGDAYINDPSWPVVEKLGHNFVMVVGCYSSGLYSNELLATKILGGMHACDGEKEGCLCGTTMSHVQLQWHVHSTAFFHLSPLILTISQTVNTRWQ